jgi:GST-like protein
MFTLYAHGSPNPHKVSIALEELGLPYEAEIVDIRAGAQFTPAFLALNPNAKVPVLVDHDAGQTVWESNAILLYLAEKAGRLLPVDPAARMRATQLLFFQAASIGPMFGQRAHFSLFAPEKPAYAVNRYEAECERLTRVVDTLLEGRDWFLGEYSIVDIAFFGWFWCAMHQGFAIDAFPHLSAWYARMAERPAVQRGVVTPLPLPDFSPFRAARVG